MRTFYISYKLLASPHTSSLVNFNFEVTGGPNPTCKKKINPRNIEYKVLDRQVVYSDQSLGAHTLLYKKDVKLIKVGTIIPFNKIALVIGKKSLAISLAILKMKKNNYDWQF